eukprot:scaffold5315_cov63-Cylindrotheca_fusiformis.AAC.1
MLPALVRLLQNQQHLIVQLFSSQLVALDDQPLLVFVASSEWITTAVVASPIAWMNYHYFAVDTSQQWLHSTSSTGTREQRKRSILHTASFDLIDLPHENKKRQNASILFWRDMLYNSEEASDRFLEPSYFAFIIGSLWSDYMEWERQKNSKILKHHFAERFPERKSSSRNTMNRVKKTTTRGERHWTSSCYSCRERLLDIKRSGVCQPGSSIPPSALLTEMIEKDKTSRSHHTL